MKRLSAFTLLLMGCIAIGYAWIEFEYQVRTTNFKTWFIEEGDTYVKV